MRLVYYPENRERILKEKRLINTGDKLFSELTMKERFMLNVQKDTSGCWGWRSPMKSGRGKSYGRLRFKDLYERAHRISYRLFVGRIPRGKVVRHTCDNRN